MRCASAERAVVEPKDAAVVADPIATVVTSAVSSRFTPPAMFPKASSIAPPLFMASTGKRWVPLAVAEPKLVVLGTVSVIGEAFDTEVEAPFDSVVLRNSRVVGCSVMVITPPVAVAVRGWSCFWLLAVTLCAFVAHAPLASPSMLREEYCPVSVNEVPPSMVFVLARLTVTVLAVLSFR